MSKISFLRISNFLGIKEQEVKAGKINLFKGQNGKGKTSVIEALEKTFTNKSRRSEVVRHGEEESTLYVELDDGLSIDRRVRTEKADYLKLRKNNEGISSTEKFLKDLVNGNIFRPLDWVNLSVKEQTKSLLSMLEIGWSEEDIVNWFGELTDNIDYSEHILIILKNIENKYYKDREEVNREIKELKARINAIVDDLPAEYDGEQWKDVNVQEYYNKVKEAQDINKWITEAKGLEENFNNKVESIKAGAENKKFITILKYKTEREDIKDLITLSNLKIEKAKRIIENADEMLEIHIQGIKNYNGENRNQEIQAYNLALKELEIKYQNEKASLVEVHNANLKSLDEVLSKEINEAKENNLLQIEEQKDVISINNTKIAAQEQKLLGLDEKEKAEKEAIENNAIVEIEKEELRIGKAAKYLEEHKEVDIEPLLEEANEVQYMASFLREWNRIAEIRDNQLAPKEEYSEILSARINKARNLPGELLQTAKMPIEGISVDVDGRVRINETLIDGLSDGEKLELAMKVAKAQCGELKVICMDKWESLDKAVQTKLIEEMMSDDYQYFITEVTDSKEVEIEKIGEVS